MSSSSSSHTPAARQALDGGLVPFAVSLSCRSGITWMTKDGLRKPNYWGSLTQVREAAVG
jgi:myo-inositol-1-phosphate synthase